MMRMPSMRTGCVVGRRLYSAVNGRYIGNLPVGNLQSQDLSVQVGDAYLETIADRATRSPGMVESSAENILRVAEVLI